LPVIFVSPESGDVVIDSFQEGTYGGTVAKEKKSGRCQGRRTDFIFSPTRRRGVVFIRWVFYPHDRPIGARLSGSIPKGTDISSGPRYSDGVPWEVECGITLLGLDPMGLEHRGAQSSYKSDIADRRYGHITMQQERKKESRQVYKEGTIPTSKRTSEWSRRFLSTLGEV
jgi:hypothetical protein